MLIAYVIPTENHFKNGLDLTTAIKSQLKELVMPYMIPQRIIYRATLPLSANGKVDIKSMIIEANTQ